MLLPKLSTPPRFQSHIVTAFSSWLFAFLLVTTFVHTRESFRLVTCMCTFWCMYYASMHTVDPRRWHTYSTRCIHPLRPTSPHTHTALTPTHPSHSDVSEPSPRWSSPHPLHPGSRWRAGFGRQPTRHGSHTGHGVLWRACALPQLHHPYCPYTQPQGAPLQFAYGLGVV